LDLLNLPFLVAPILLIYTFFIEDEPGGMEKGGGEGEREKT
jgi:hypothetical protein